MFMYIYTFFPYCWKVVEVPGGVTFTLDYLWRNAQRSRSLVSDVSVVSQLLK